MLQRHMILPVQRHEARAGNAGRHLAAELEPVNRILAQMQHQRRNAHLGQ